MAYCIEFVKTYSTLIGKYALKQTLGEVVMEVLGLRFFKNFLRNFLLLSLAPGERAAPPANVEAER